MLSLAGFTSAALAGVTPMKWIFNGPAVPILAADAATNRRLANAQPYVLQKAGAAAVPTSWNALPVRSFTNYLHLKRALEANSIDSTVRAILYDNEGWQFTPLAEQRDPATFTQLAAQIVHEHHLLFIAAPAVNITKLIMPDADKRYDAYLQLHIAADAARFADVFVIQAQGSQSDVERYAAFVRAATQQARAANPKVLILAGISTNPSGQHVTADTVLRAIHATRSIVAGYWFNIPKPSAYCTACNDFRPDIAIEVLKRI